MVKISPLADDIAHAATTFSAAKDPTSAGVTGVQRHAVPDIPLGLWRAAGVSNLAVHGGDGIELSVSVTAGSIVVRRIGGPRTHIAGDRLVLGPSGYRLGLTLETTAGGSVVVTAPVTADQSAA